MILYDSILYYIISCCIYLYYIYIGFYIALNEKYIIIYIVKCYIKKYQILEYYIVCYIRLYFIILYYIIYHTILYYTFLYHIDIISHYLYCSISYALYYAMKLPSKLGVAYFLRLRSVGQPHRMPRLQHQSHCCIGLVEEFDAGTDAWEGAAKIKMLGPCSSSVLIQ